MTEWTPVDPDRAWSPKEVGEQVQGVLERKGRHQGRYRETAFYILREPDGQRCGVYGSAALDRQLNQVSTGELIRITYGGRQEQESGGTVLLYKVEIGQQDAEEA